MNENMDDRETIASEQSTQTKRKRAKTSRCWKSFCELPVAPDGKTYAKCIKCGREYQFQSTSRTSSLNRHHDECSALGVSPRSATRSSTFKHERFCELIIQAIVKHDLPFSFVEYEGIRAIFAYLSPTLRLPCRNTVKAHVTKIYVAEKLKVQEMLSSVKGRICLTSDLWSSQSTDGYLTLTAHFIDTEWNLHKKILSFCHMPPPHNGNALADKIHSLILDWEIDQNLFSITLDNASANDSFIEKLRTQLNLRRRLLLNGKFFHIRCCAHILNLIVQDGLKAIDASVVKVRDSIKYIKGSMARKHRFLECVALVDMLGDKPALRQDVPTRWNSTHKMLESAIHYRRALINFALCDSDFKTCPSDSEWEKIEMISAFLYDFYEVTCLFSGTTYPTSNLFFPQVFRIQYSIKDAMRHEDGFMQQMGEVMNAKFQKYWSDYSFILGIAVVMDPRYKRKFVKWAFDKLYEEDSATEMRRFDAILRSLFDVYQEKWSTQADSGSRARESRSHPRARDILFQDFDDLYRDGTNSSTNELDKYLREDGLERTTDLNVLTWWKAEQFRYPILSRLASDILTIPISTVASESAFSIAGRVLDQYRSSLLPETVQDLLCTRDWLFGKKDQDSVVLDELVDDVLDLTVDQENEVD